MVIILRVGVSLQKIGANNMSVLDQEAVTLDTYHIEESGGDYPVHQHVHRRINTSSSEGQVAQPGRKRRSQSKRAILAGRCRVQVA